MTAEEIQLFNHSIAYHQPVAIGSFIIFVLIYRSKFYSHKKQSDLNAENMNPKIETVTVAEN